MLVAIGGGQDVLIILDQSTVQQLSGHDYHYLQFGAIPMLNTDDLTTTSSSNGAISKPKYVIHMLLDKKDSIDTENTSVSSNEIFELCEDLLYILNKTLRKLAYYHDYGAGDDIQDVCVVFLFFGDLFCFFWS